MKDLIEKIKKDLNVLNLKIEANKKALDFLQQICDHDFNWKGHGHKENIYECSVCGLNKAD